MAKKIVVLNGSPVAGGCSETLSDYLIRGAQENGNTAVKMNLSKMNLHPCIGCNGCKMGKGSPCVQKDDMAEILNLFQEADVLVLATPIYFYGITAQMKVFIDRTYPIWQNLGEKEVYYIISAGLDKDIIERSLGDLDGFVEHLDKYDIKGRIYATEVMDAGLVKGTALMNDAYCMGKNV